MSIKLAIAGGPTIVVSDETITLGSDPSCMVSIPESTGALPKHAVIRKIAGRWLIEGRDAETVIVGDHEPKRVFWLNSGDVIRLTEQGPGITFKSSEDDPLSTPASTAAATPATKPASTPAARPALTPSLSDVILPPDSNPSIPTRKSSASIPVTKPPSSAIIKTTKPPSSSIIKTTKAPSSGTIRSRPPSSTTIRAVGSSDASKPAAKLNRSSADIPVPGAPLKRKSSQHQITTSGDDDVVANVPTLQRLSSWDEEDPTQRKGLTEEQAELRWIMMVVGRSIGCGLAVLVLWIVINYAISSMNPASVETVSPPSVPGVEQNAVSPPSPPPAQRTGFNSDPVRPKPTNVRTPEAPKRKADPDQDSSTAKNDEANARKPKESDPATTVAETDGQSGRTKPPIDDSAAASGTELTSGSPVLRAVKDGIYAVVVENSDKSKQIQLGTAWAASNRYLVTSASVVSAIEENREKGLVASVVQISTGKIVRIKTTKMHETYRKASESAEDAREQRDATRLAAQRAIQVRFDLGLIDVGRGERLPKKIASMTDPIDDSNESVFVVVGLPFQQKDEAESAEFNEASLKERRCKKPTTGVAPQNKDMELTIQFVPDANGRNWTGSPILNKDHKVIGVYSCLPSTGAIGGKAVKTETGVAWIGRLHEFVPDLE